MKQKRCTDCKDLKLERDFYKDKHRANGYKSYCKSCASKRAIKFNKSKGSDYSKDKRLKDTYGISLEHYNQMFLKQEGCCAICKKHQSNFTRALAIDHCHKTGNIRALLCHKCNSALGLSNDSIDLLKEMISYLEEHNS